MKFARAVVLGGSLLGAWIYALGARAASADALFTRGVAEFKNGNYSAAAKDFEQAHEAGIATPALYYNLGASLYRLGRYEEAEEAFRQCAANPAWSALAYYNMGLSAYARDARATAREHFEQAWRIAEAEDVRALAAAMLDRLGVAEPRARGTIHANLGYNDNVTLTADNQVVQNTRQGDAFAELYGATDGRFSSGVNATRWNASLYALDYRHLSDNDITELLLGVAQPATAAAWRLEVGAQGQYALRDGQKFEQIGTLRLQGTRDLADRRDLRVTLQTSAIDALDPDFEFLSGTRAELQISLGESWSSAAVVRSGITWERNDRKDLTTATEFFSYSPTRYGAWVTGVWPIGASWRVEPTALYYQSRYADPDRRASGVVATRHDQHVEVSLRAKRRLSAYWQLTAEYSYTRNNSNFSEFTFSQNIFAIGLARPF